MMIFLLLLFGFLSLHTDTQLYRCEKLFQQLDFQLTVVRTTIPSKHLLTVEMEQKQFLFSICSHLYRCACAHTYTRTSQWSVRVAEWKQKHLHGFCSRRCMRNMLVLRPHLRSHQNNIFLFSLLCALLARTAKTVVNVAYFVDISAQFCRWGSNSSVRGWREYGIDDWFISTKNFC